MNLISEARSLLEEAKYWTHMPDITGSMFYFEDHSLMGFLSVHDSFEDILNKWEKKQDLFITKNADRLRTSSDKAWNVYSVFLTAKSCPPKLLSKLYEIEEDFRGTRKVVRTGIETNSDLKIALITFLPIQNVIMLESEDLNKRLIESLVSIDRTFSDLLKISSEELVRRLLEDE